MIAGLVSGSHPTVELLVHDRNGIFVHPKTWMSKQPEVTRSNQSNELVMSN